MQAHTQAQKNAKQALDGSTFTCYFLFAIVCNFFDNHNQAEREERAMNLWTVKEKPQYNWTAVPEWVKEPFNPFEEEVLPSAFPNTGKSLMALLHREDRDRTKTKWIVFDREEEGALEQIGRMFFDEKPAFNLLQAVAECAYGRVGDVVYVDESLCKDWHYHPKAESTSCFLAVRIRRRS